MRKLDTFGAFQEALDRQAAYEREVARLLKEREGNEIRAAKHSAWLRSINYRARVGEDNTRRDFSSAAKIAAHLAGRERCLKTTQGIIRSPYRRYDRDDDESQKEWQLHQAWWNGFDAQKRGDHYQLNMIAVTHDPHQMSEACLDAGLREWPRLDISLVVFDESADKAADLIYSAHKADLLRNLNRWGSDAAAFFANAAEYGKSSNWRDKNPYPWGLTWVENEAHRIWAENQKSF